MWEKIFLAVTLTFSLSLFVQLVPATSQQTALTNSHPNASFTLSELRQPLKIFIYK